MRSFGVVCLAGFMPICAQAMTLTEAIQHAWQAAPLFHEQLQADERLYGIAKVERWQRLLPNEPQVFYGTTDDKTSEVWGVSETVGLPGKALAYVKQDRLKEEGARAEWEAKRFEVTQQVAQAYMDSAVALATVDQQKRNIIDQETLGNSLKGTL